LSFAQLLGGHGACVRVRIRSRSDLGVCHLTQGHF
jgi:hypothetical protein